MKPLWWLITCAALTLATLWCGLSVRAAPTPVLQEAVAPLQPRAEGPGWAMQIDAGYLDTCVLTADGRVNCWGYNEQGAVGDGTMHNRAIPVAVAGLNEAVLGLSVDSHTCALTESNSVWCWGTNDHGELGNGTTANSLVPTAVVGLTSGVQAIDVNAGHTCTLMISGGVKCWGHNSDGQLGDGTNISRTTPVDVLGLSAGVQAISVGSHHTCALTVDGGVKCWGWNQLGQLGDGTTTSHATPVEVMGLHSGVRAISTGYMFTCALTAEGGVKCWGDNTGGKLGDGTKITRLTPVDVIGLNTGIQAISVGDWHTCVMTAQAKVKCWGANGYGQLGDSTRIDRKTPVETVGLPAAVRGISVGGGHSCAVLEDDTVQCWGGNQYGQLGDGTTTDRLTPTSVILELPYDCTTVSEIPPNQCQALATLFRATNGPFWRDHTGWLRTPTPCSWYGVACAAGHVSTLVLPANNLVDTLPAALSDLPALQRLDLHGNDLAGSLPATLGNLSALQYLDLSASGLAGATLPPEWRNLSALQTLDLHGNALAGTIPAAFGSLIALQTLDLSANTLSGPLPTGLADLTQLRTLDLHANQLSGPLPADLGRLVAAQTIDLSSNAITGPLPADLGDAAALRTLDLSANQLSGPLPWTWSRLTALERLDLAHNALSGELPPEWSLLPALQHLDLSYNTLSGWLPPAYSQWTPLRYLDLSFNELRGPLPAAWGSLSHIQTLSLNNNHLAGPILAAWGALGSAGPATGPATIPDSNADGTTRPAGIYLDFSCNRLSGAIPVELARLGGLQAVNLASNQLRGAVPDELLQGRAPDAYVEDNLLVNLRDGTQTVPPPNWRAAFSAPDTVTLTWAPLASYAQFYEISYATTPGGPFTVHGQTHPDSLTYTVTGLQPNVPYYFRARAFTPAHESQSPGWGDLFEHYYYQQSNLWSEYTPLVSVNVAPARVFLPLVGRGADDGQ